MISVVTNEPPSLTVKRFSLVFWGHRTYFIEKVIIRTEYFIVKIHLEGCIDVTIIMYTDIVSFQAISFEVKAAVRSCCIKRLVYSNCN